MDIMGKTDKSKGYNHSDIIRNALRNEPAWEEVGKVTKGIDELLKDKGENNGENKG